MYLQLLNYLISIHFTVLLRITISMKQELINLYTECSVL